MVPRVVHLEWSVCSVKDFKVLESSSSIVNPGVALDAATVAATRVTQEAVTSQGVSLQQALDKVSQLSMMITSFTFFGSTAVWLEASGIIWFLTEFCTNIVC